MDYYRLDAIRHFLTETGFVLRGLDIGMFQAMGDRAAVSLIKIFYPVMDLKSVPLKRVLAALSLAFNDIGKIEIAEDRIPAASLTLLELLLRHAMSDEDRQAINETRTRIEQERMT